MADVHGAEPSSQRGLAAQFSIFRVSLIICGLAAVWGIADPQGLAETLMGITTYCLDAFDWAFLLSIAIFILCCFFLAFSRYGDLKLGGHDEEPEFDVVSWVAMLFAAGMGAGLLFWGVAEPLTHYMSPPPGNQPMSSDAARYALVVTNLHWGIHAWGIYAMSGLVLGYYGFRKGYPLLASSPIRAVFPGTFGRVLGGAADLVAVLAVTFGIAGSLGMGVVQINAGIAEVFGTPEESLTMIIGILLVLIAFYMIPVSTRLDKGIKYLSNLNVAIVVLMMLYILFWGPTAFALSTFATSLGDYITSVINLSFRLYPYSGETEWSRTWTLTYLIWWIAWAPFVGIFIARISRGRTVREFVITVILVPTVFSILWFAICGGTGLYLELFGEGGLGSVVLENPSKALFSFFGYFPLTVVLALTTIFLIFVFLSTSAASGAFVLGMMTSAGALDPPRSRKLFWGAVIAVLTAAILLAGGEVHVLRAIAISGALPFAAIMIVHIACLFHSLAKAKTLPRPELEEEPEPRTATGQEASR